MADSLTVNQAIAVSLGSGAVGVCLGGIMSLIVAGITRRTTLEAADQNNRTAVAIAKQSNETTLKAIEISKTTEERIEHAQWRRREIIAIGTEVAELAQKKWDRIRSLSIFIHHPDPEFKKRAGKDVTDEGYQIEADRLRLLSAKASLFSEDKLAELIEELYSAGRIHDPLEQIPESVFKEKRAEVLRVRFRLIEECSRILKVV